MRAAIVDAGPLVAFVDRAEQHHRWAAARIEELEAPLLVCEPVLAEAMHLLARLSRAQDAVFGLLENDALRIALRMEEHLIAPQAAFEISGQADVACGCMCRADGRDS